MSIAPGIPSVEYTPKPGAASAPPQSAPSPHDPSKFAWFIRTALRQIAFNAIPILVVMAIWQAIAVSGLVPTAFFPPLQTIFAAIGEMAATGVLWTDIALSMYRLLLSVVVGIVIGTGIGLLMGTNKWVERFLLPLMNFGLAVPGIALVPLVILLFGLSDLTIIIILIAEVVLVTMLNTWTAVRSVDQRLIDAGRTMGAKGLEMFTHVLFPGALVGIIGGYRLAFSRGWRILIAGELLTGVAGGLGYRIFEAREYFRADIIYGGILVIGVIGLILERVVLRSIETATVERWGAVRKGE